MIGNNATDIDHRDHEDMASYQEDRVAALKRRVAELEQRNADLECQLSDALEHRPLFSIIGKGH